MHLLHLEDSAEDADLMARVILREWPGCRITHVASLDAFSAALEDRGIDLILSDYTLPGADGLSALALARRSRPEKPFIFVSGTIGEERAVEALKCGATDYVMKDRPGLLVPAIRQAIAVGTESERLREAQVALRKQAALLDRARDAIIATDPETRIVYWNASAERLYGWSAGEVCGRRLDELGIGFEAGRFAAARAQVLEHGEWRGEFRLRTKAGGTVLVESTWSLVSGNDGRLPSILAIDTDITERRKLETQLLQAQRMESIGTLAGGVAHDLNNVLTPILLAMDLFGKKLTSPEDRMLVDETRASAAHGAALVQQLLVFARGGEARRVRVDPAQALRELLPRLRRSLPSAITVEFTAPEEAWPILTDPTQFNQIVINLCSNARDAMPHGGRIGIRIRHLPRETADGSAVPGTKPGPLVGISVADTGVGIAPEIQPRIFDPFFTTKAAGEGTGLGLSMVAGIMKRHGGAVQVESEPGQGTVLHLFFPALSEPAPVRSEPAAGPARAAGGDAILVIDDEPIVRTTLRILLERSGYRVLTADDVRGGIDRFHAHVDEIGLVITDMMLPDGLGTGVVAALRARRPELPVIAISGMMASGEFEELERLSPPVVCLAKPLVPEALLQAVQRAVGKR